MSGDEFFSAVGLLEDIMMKLVNTATPFYIQNKSGL